MDNLDDLVRQYMSLKDKESKRLLAIKFREFEPNDIIKASAVEISKLVKDREEIPYIEFLESKKISRYINLQYLKRSTYESYDQVMFESVNDFGVLDNNKIKYLFDNKKNKNVIRRFFKGRDDKTDISRVNSNIKIFWKYCFNELFEEEYKFCEFAPDSRFGEIRVRQGDFRKITTSRQAMEFAFDDYGVLTFEKIEHIRTFKTTQGMRIRQKFFGENKERENLKVLIDYICKENKIIEEEIERLDLTVVGMGNATEKRYKTKFIEDFLEENYENYGVVNDEKSKYLIERVAKRGNDSRSQKAFKIFLNDDNPHRDENYQNLISALRVLKGKQNFTKEELGCFSIELNRYNSGSRDVEEKSNERKVRKSEDTNPDINKKIRIKWTNDLVERLEEIALSVPEKLKDSAYIWENLGTTCFAAILKTQRMGFVEDLIKYSDRKVEKRMSTYPLIDFEGMKYIDYAYYYDVNQGREKVDAYLFYPVYKQHAHIQLPFEYGEFGDWERKIIGSICSINSIHGDDKDDGIVHFDDVGEDKVYLSNSGGLFQRELVFPVRTKDKLTTKVVMPNIYDVKGNLHIMLRDSYVVVHNMGESGYVSRG